MRMCSRFMAISGTDERQLDFGLNERRTHFIFELTTHG